MAAALPPMVTDVLELVGNRLVRVERATADLEDDHPESEFLERCPDPEEVDAALTCLD